LFLFAFFKFGKFANYLSEPVMNGFISGMAVAIIIGQLPKLAGLESAGTNFLKNILIIVHDAALINPLSLIIGFSIIAIVLVGKRFAPRLPLSLVVLVVATFITYYFQLDQHGVAIIGDVPSGLPKLEIPNLFLPDIVQIASIGFAIAIIIAADSLLSVRSFANKNRYKIRDNQELFAFGFSNIFASLSGTTPTSSSVSRTAMSEQYGGKTQLVGIIAAIIVGLILLFFSGVLHYLPIPSLAAIVICALIHLIDIRTSRTLKKHSKAEFTIWLVAALGVLFISVLFGVVMAIILSFADFIRRASTPHHAILGKIEGRKGHFDISRHKNAKPIDGVLIYRFSAPLFFGNANLFKQTILTMVQSTKPKVKVVVIDASGITNIDITAMNTLKRLFVKLSDKGAKIYIARTIGPVKDQLNKSGIGQKTHFFKTIREAVEAAEK